MQEDMTSHYKHTRRTLRALRTLNTDKAERQIIGEMISDCTYAIEWLQTGRRPGNMRGIERRAAYQREYPIDPIRIQAYVSGNHAGSPANITEWQQFQIDDSLRILSPLEREVFLMAYAGCVPRSQIAAMIGIKKGSVNKMIDRANKKIQENMQNSLFY